MFRPSEILPPFGSRPAGDTVNPVGNAGFSPMERAVFSDPRELWYLALPEKMTPMQVAQLLRSALAGDIWQQWQLSRKMADTWPVFRKAAHELLEAVAYIKYRVQPHRRGSEPPTDRAVEKAKLVEKAMDSFQPDPFTDERGFSGMCYLLCDAVLSGISLVELIWRRDTESGEWLPRACAWVHPRHYTFDENGRLVVWSSEALIRSSPANVPAGYTANAPDPRKFICAQFLSWSGSSLGNGLMRPLAWAWAARMFNLEWMLNTAKRFGSPFLDITYKPGSLSDEDRKALDQMLQTAAALNHIKRPDTTSLNVVPPATVSGDNPQRVLEDKADEWCLYLLLGQKGTTIETPGRLGNTDVHASVKAERMLGIAQWLARGPLRAFARAVLLMNYGNADDCPEITPDATRQLTLQERLNALGAFSFSKVPVRVDEMYATLGFTAPTEGDSVFVNGEFAKFGSEQEAQGMPGELLDFLKGLEETQGEGAGAPGRNGSGRPAGLEEQEEESEEEMEGRR
jgi:phage gp29-like protein